jgi:hypothetical protein
MAIDKPTDKIREIVSTTDDGLFDSLVKTAGVFNIPLKLFSLLKDVLDGADRKDRIRKAVFAVCDELERLGHSIDTQADEPWFRKAVETLVTEAARSADEHRALQIGVAFARGCIPDPDNTQRREELATYLRELAQLSIEDVRMLRILRDVNMSAIKTYPNLNDPNPFTENFSILKAHLSELRIHPDDAVSTCTRLAGFGLAAEVARNPSRQSAGEHCFRPTKRGLYVLMLLEAVSTAPAKAN